MHIKEEKQVSQDQVLKGGRELLIFSQNSILSQYFVSFLLEAGNKKVPVLAIEIEDTGSFLILKIK
jgi:hypothetical protein